jgi:hypothetical protein
LLAAVIGGGWVFGPVRWLGAAMLGAGAAFLLLNFAPAWICYKRQQRHWEN